MVVAAGTIVSKVHNNLLDFIAGSTIDGKCVGIANPWLTAVVFLIRLTLLKTYLLYVILVMN